MRLKKDRLIDIRVAICGYPHGCEYNAKSHTVRREHVAVFIFTDFSRELNQHQHRTGPSLRCH